MRVWIGARKTEEVANKVKDAILNGDFGCQPRVEIKQETDRFAIDFGNFNIIVSNVDWNDADKIQDFINNAQIY